MSTRKPKPKKKAMAREFVPVYTHRDTMGVRWRMVGSRPVSELADKTMRDCGLPYRE